MSNVKNQRWGTVKDTAEYVGCSSDIITMKRKQNKIPRKMWRYRDDTDGEKIHQQVIEYDMEAVKEVITDMKERGEIYVRKRNSRKKK